MSFPSYLKYKDSRVLWLGDLPAHWQVFNACRIFRQVREPAFPNDQQLSASQKYGVIPQTLYMELEDQKVVLAMKGLDGFKHTKKNDFIISLRSFQGGLECSRYDGCVSPAYTVCRINKPSHPDFLAYLLKSNPFISVLQALTDGIREGKSISFSQFGSVPLPLPSVDEQIEITEFLDRETAKIDALLNEQQKLIELLKEKRQTLISAAVTGKIDVRNLTSEEVAATP